MVKQAKQLRKLIAAVGYLRCSTKEQDTSIEEQRRAIIAYAKLHGYRIVRWYIDDGWSGDDSSRPDFRRMHADACGQSRDFDAILCWDQDRFGRFSPHEASFWTWPLSQAGIRLVTLDKGPIDWTDFVEWLSYSVNQHGKHQFLKDLSRNVLRGQIEAAKAGSWIGDRPFGYRIEGPRKQKRLIVEETEARTVRRIFAELVEQGRSMRDIARRLNADGVRSASGKQWRYDAVRTILANVAYIGTYRFNVNSRAKHGTHRGGQYVKGARTGRNDESDWIVRENWHDPIIDRRTFDRAQALLARGKTASQHATGDTPFLLSRVLRCGKCGSAMWGYTDTRGVRRYECAKRQEDLKADRHPRCEGTTVAEDIVLDRIAFEIGNLLSDDEDEALRAKARAGKLTPADVPQAFANLKRIMGVDDQPRIDPKAIKRRIDAIQARIDKAKANLVLLDPENIPAAQQTIRQLEADRATLRAESKQQPSEAEINQTVLDVLGKCLRLYSLDPDRLRPVLREIERIDVHTAVSGEGRRRRHTFKRGEIHFAGIGCINGRVVQPYASLAPVRGLTRKSNLRLLLQRQAAYR